MINEITGGQLSKKQHEYQTFTFFETLFIGLKSEKINFRDFARTLRNFCFYMTKICSSSRINAHLQYLRSIRRALLTFIILCIALFFLIECFKYSIHFHRKYLFFKSNSLTNRQLSSCSKDAVNNEREKGHV